MFIYFLLGIIASLVYVYYKVVKPSKYWEERDVVHVKSWPLVGSMRDFVLKKHITEVSIDVYKQYPNARWANVFV
jgi:cytochrome P450 family 9